MRMILRLLSLTIVTVLLNACVNPYNLSEGIASFCNQDYRQAFIRLKPEAERGQPEAMYAVGYMYYYGQGVVEDRKQACVWISRSARAGNPKAIAALQIIDATKNVIMQKKMP